MDKLALVVSLTLSTILSTQVISGQDFHLGRDDSLMPGVRRYRERSVTPTRPPFVDTPIFFPGFEGPGRRSEGLPGEVSLPNESGTSSGGALELPPNFSEINVSVLNRINSITNISDFASLFDLELPQPKPTFEFSFDVSGRIGDSVSEDGETFEMANCKPELVTVPLELPSQADTMFFPTCVRLEQCGGCCYGPLLTCRPTVTKVVKVKVLKISTVSSSNTVRGGEGGGGGGRRLRRQSQQSYHLVEVVKHTACECGCRVREEDCNSDLHVYFEGECACKCKNKDEQTKCEQQNSTKYWDNESCNCFCRRAADCGTGEIFSQTTCGCERLGARHGLVRGEEGTEA